MGEISAGAACDPAMRGFVDNRRAVLRNAAAQRLRNTESAPPAARANAEPEDVSRHVGGFYRRARRPSFGELRGNRLGGLGRPDGFVRRQITGWMDRWEKAKTVEVPLMNKLGAWFLENLPAPQAPVLLHNDFYLHNVMFALDNSGKVTGVFDWEMSTLGDPMVDLGIALGYWRDADDPEELIELSEGYAHTTKPGFMTRRELAERYAQRSGRDISNIAFYRAWAHWKTATVVQQIYVRFVRGQTSDPRFESMGTHPPVLARAAARVVAKLGFKE